MTVRRFLWGAAAAALAACSVLAPRFEKPEVSVAGVEMAGGNLLQQNFRVKLNVRNPNNRDLPVIRLHAELNVGGEHVASGDNDHAFVVPAQGSTDVDINVTANLALTLLKLAQRPDGGSGSIDYAVTGSASLDLPFLHDLPFRQQGSFSLKNN